MVGGWTRWAHFQIKRSGYENKINCSGGDSRGSGYFGKWNSRLRRPWRWARRRGPPALVAVMEAEVTMATAEQATVGVTAEVTAFNQRSAGELFSPAL